MFKFKDQPFIDKISVVDYNALPCLRSTHLKEFMKSPAHYKWYVSNPDANEGAKHLVFGSYVHALLLEPDIIDSQFIVVDMKTRHNKEFHAASARAKQTGKMVLLADEVLDAQRIAENVHNDPHVMALLNASFAEISAAAKIADVWMKVRLDAYIPEQRIIIDIKTTGESIYWFGNNIKRYGYDISAPLYMDVLNTAAMGTGECDHGADRYMFLVLEKQPPYGVKLFEMSPVYMDEGRSRYMRALPEFKKCLDTGVWAGYDNSTVEVLYPFKRDGQLTPNERVIET